MAKKSKRLIRNSSVKRSKLNRRQGNKKTKRRKHWKKRTMRGGGLKDFRAFYKLNFEIDDDIKQKLDDGFEKMKLYTKGLLMRKSYYYHLFEIVNKDEDLKKLLLPDNELLHVNTNKTKKKIRFTDEIAVKSTNKFNDKGQGKVKELNKIKNSHLKIDHKGNDHKGNDHTGNEVIIKFIKDTTKNEPTPSYIELKLYDDEFLRIYRLPELKKNKKEVETWDYYYLIYNFIKKKFTVSSNDEINKYIAEQIKKYVREKKLERIKKDFSADILICKNSNEPEKNSNVPKKWFAINVDRELFGFQYVTDSNYRLYINFSDHPRNHEDYKPINEKKGEYTGDKLTVYDLEDNKYILKDENVDISNKNTIHKKWENHWKEQLNKNSYDEDIIDTKPKTIENIKSFAKGLGISPNEHLGISPEICGPKSKEKLLSKMNLEDKSLVIEAVQRNIKETEEKEAKRKKEERRENRAQFYEEVTEWREAAERGIRNRGKEGFKVKQTSKVKHCKGIQEFFDRYFKVSDSLDKQIKEKICPDNEKIEREDYLKKIFKNLEGYEIATTSTGTEIAAETFTPEMNKVNFRSTLGRDEMNKALNKSEVSYGELFSGPTPYRKYGNYHIYFISIPGKMIRKIEKYILYDTIKKTYEVFDLNALKGALAVLPSAGPAIENSIEGLNEPETRELLYNYKNPEQSRFDFSSPFTFNASKSLPVETTKVFPFSNGPRNNSHSEETFEKVVDFPF
jgi:hypothetical protein